MLSELFKPKVRACSVCVVVLGDINRSPRMRYHCISLANAGYNVKVIAYLPGGSRPVDFAPQVNIDLCPLAEAPDWMTKMPKAIGYMFKFTWLAWLLMWSLFVNARKCSVILVQNPPALPTLPICGIFALLFRLHLILDFHNYAYSLLALSVSRYHPFVWLTKVMERFCGRLFASASFCVSKAMQRDLKERWLIDSVVLYDRPREIFKPATAIQSHELFLRLSADWQCFRGNSAKETALTESTGPKEAEWKTSRPLLVVSSTSWTPDEDFGQFFDALDRYDKAVDTSSSTLSNLIVVVTGRGPLREQFLERAETTAWNHIDFVAPWLSNSDYAVLLGSADAGVCCHWSSSGLDLPMKVVDMLGAGLPVLARGDYESLPELVTEENGLVFRSTDDLFKQLCHLSTEPNQFKKMRKNTLSRSSDPLFRWSGNWTSVALPVIEKFDK